MKPKSEPQCDLSVDRLERAIQAMITPPAPSDVRQRVTERAAAWRKDSTSGHPQQREYSSFTPSALLESNETKKPMQAVHPAFRRRLRMATFATALPIAIVAVMATLWLFRPNESWAQVAETLRAVPWCVARYTTPEGVIHEDWTSTSRNISAHRHGDVIWFFDHGLGITYTYNSNERILTRRLDSQGNDTKAERAFEEVFQQILRGDATLRFDSVDCRIVQQKKGSVTRNGRDWTTYDLEIRTINAEVPDNNTTVRATFVVDPNTHLPHFLQLSQASMTPPLIEMELGFPESGPVDIFDLGVPQDAMLVDLVPSDDIRQVISQIKTSAQRFEDHVALNVLSDAGMPWYVGTPYTVWRRGTSYRMAYGLVDSASALPDVPPTNADERQWWMNRWTELFHAPHEICDGSTYWSNEARPAGWNDQPNKPNPITWDRTKWPQPQWNSRQERSAGSTRTAPLHIAYPQNLVNLSNDSTPILILSPTDDAANIVKVILRTGVASSPSGEERFWIDTHRSHMVVRHDSVTFDLSHVPPGELISFSEIVEKADRSPQGIWYPTLIRHIFPMEKNGEKTTVETITRHYLDFAVNFTDGMFKPNERPGEGLK